MKTLPDLDILLVDDDPAILSALRRGITRGWAQWGAEARVHLCTSPSTALGRLLTESVDIVIADYRMPEMEGIETIQALRRKCPTIPIIAISGGGRVEPKNYLSLAEQIGANRTFAKPFRLDEILTAVRELTAKIT